MMSVDAIGNSIADFAPGPIFGSAWSSRKDSDPVHDSKSCYVFHSVSQKVTRGNSLKICMHAIGGSFMTERIPYSGPKQGFSRFEHFPSLIPTRRNSLKYCHKKGN